MGSCAERPTRAGSASHRGDQGEERGVSRRDHRSSPPPAEAGHRRAARGLGPVQQGRWPSPMQIQLSNGDEVEGHWKLQRERPQGSDTAYADMSKNQKRRTRRQQLQTPGHDGRPGQVRASRQHEDRERGQQGRDVLPQQPQGAEELLQGGRADGHARPRVEDPHRGRSGSARKDGTLQAAGCHGQAPSARRQPLGRSEETVWEPRGKAASELQLREPHRSSPSQSPGRWRGSPGPRGHAGR